uniref:Ubiquitin-like protease family profile domain-containing protein n=1 Tax=viral metagenome TaxID=1070528 RepID=A0A6C0D7A6_9ZZZZ
MRNSKTHKKKKSSLSEAGPEQCHPRVGVKRPSEGCIPNNILVEVASKLNVQANRALIEKALNLKPKQEYSFVKALPLDENKKRELIKQYLRPKQPDEWKEDPDKWLNSLDITNVMNQYEEAYSEFEFMGPYPIDFAAPEPYNKTGKCLIEEMCEIKTSIALQNGTKYIGIIYNLDPHFKSGSHWVATFIDLVKHKTYYFDSYGMEPPEQIKKFMKWLTTQDSQMKLFYNGRRFQYQSSECGMYSMFFIIRMLMGDDFQAFSRKAPPDSFMLDLRDWFFST